MTKTDDEGARRRRNRDEHRPDWRTLPVTADQKRYIASLLGQVPEDARPRVVMTRGDASDAIAALRATTRAHGR